MTAKIMEWRSHSIELVGDTMLEALTSTLQESSQTQNCLDKLEIWPKVNKRKFNKDKCKVVNFERNNQMLKNEENRLGSRKDLCYWEQPSEEQSTAQLQKEQVSS